MNKDLRNELQNQDSLSAQGEELVKNDDFVPKEDATLEKDEDSSNLENDEDLLKKDRPAINQIKEYERKWKKTEEEKEKLQKENEELKILRSDYETKMKDLVEVKDEYVSERNFLKKKGYENEQIEDQIELLRMRDEKYEKKFAVPEDFRRTIQNTNKMSRDSIINELKNDKKIGLAVRKYENDIKTEIEKEVPVDKWGNEKILRIVAKSIIAEHLDEINNDYLTRGQYRSRGEEENIIDTNLRGGSGLNMESEELKQFISENGLYGSDKKLVLAAFNSKKKFLELVEKNLEKKQN